MKKNIFPQFVFALVLTAMTLLASCTSEKEVDLDLPAYERQLVVESFLEPGKPYALLLQESVSYFDAPDTPFVDGATVTMFHNGQTITLQNQLYFDFASLKFYNYVATDIVPVDYTEPFGLEVTDGSGRRVTGSTTMLQPVGIDSMFAAFNDENKAAINIWWKDTPNQPSYYLLTLHRNEITNDGLELAFTLDDRVGDGEDFTLSTFFEYESGDSVIATLYTIDYDFWKYLGTADDAESANGNPFGHPTSIISTVEGGIGAFVAFHPQRQTYIVP